MSKEGGKTEVRRRRSEVSNTQRSKVRGQKSVKPIKSTFVKGISFSPPFRKGGPGGIYIGLPAIPNISSRRMGKPELTIEY
jgi:hypothetical protein